MNENKSEKFSVDGRDVRVYPSDFPHSPVIYLNTFAAEGDSVYQELVQMTYRDCSLVAISNLDWNRDMAPWNAPALNKMDVPCVGGADEYLELLTTRIMPKAEKILGKPISWRGLAGYSLAGLFAVYAIFKSGAFDRIGSMSGSMWFPKFKEYVFTHDPVKVPDAMYFSLGDKESHTKNQYLKTTQIRTEEIEEHFEQMGVPATFRLNPGNHYRDAFKRCAMGIAWLLEQ